MHGGPDETAAVWTNTMAGLVLTVLLYLGGEPDVIKLVHPGTRPAKESIRRRDPDRFRDRRDPSHYAVGKEFSRAIERWEIEHGQDAGMARTIRSNMRRGALASVLDGRRPAVLAGALSCCPSASRPALGREARAAGRGKVS